MVIKMRIIIDAMGGDNAPGAVVEGVCMARDELSGKVELTLVGDEARIKAVAAEKGLTLDGIDIVHTDIAIGMEESPMLIAKGKKECSMAVGLKMLTDNKRNTYGRLGDAFVSAGSTGALHMGSSLFVGRLPGVRRSGIAVLMPFDPPLLLMDSGANPTAKPEYLYQWAVVGSVYMKTVLGAENPRVGLLNNGTEECKGNEMSVEAYRLLSESGLNFVGNIEAREIPFGPCDVIVCDGFTGNVVLKLTEGMSKFLLGKLKEIFTSGGLAGLSYLMIKSKLSGMKSSFDSSAHGGAPLLGLDKPVFKAHGSSDGRAIYNAILGAKKCVELDVIGKMRAELEASGGLDAGAQAE